MTYAAHDFARPEPLADMIARRDRFERMADAFAINNDPANARLYEDEAAAEAARIGVRMRCAEHAAARIDHDRKDIPVYVFGQDDPETIRRDNDLLMYLLAAPVIYAGIVWGIPLVCAALAGIGGAG